MPESTYTWVVVAGYVLVVLTLTLRGRLGTAGFKVFSVGSRDRHPVLIGLSVAAGSASSTTFVINPGLVYLYGWSGFVAIFFASSLGFFVGLVLFSKRFRQVGDQVAALTLPQWIGDRFRSPALKTGFALASLLQVAYVVLIVVALSQVLAKTLSVPIFGALCFVVLFTCAYLAVGGAGAHVTSNSVQAMLMLAVAVWIVAQGWRQLSGAGVSFFEQLHKVGPHYASLTNPDSQLYRDAFEVLIAQFVIGLAAALLPHLIAKSLYLRSERDVKLYLSTAVVAVLGMKSVLLAGLFARLSLGAEVLSPDTVMATYFVHSFSPLARALITLGILAAGFSTLEGILLSLSSIFANDLVMPFLKRSGDGVGSSSSAQPLRLARIFLLLVAPVTIWLAWRQIVAPSLSVIIFAFNGILALAAATFVPVLVGIYSRRPSATFPDEAQRRQVWCLAAASVVALAVHYVWVLGKVLPYHDNPMVPATWAIVASMATYLAMRLALRSRGLGNQSMGDQDLGKDPKANQRGDDP